VVSLFPEIFLSFIGAEPYKKIMSPLKAANIAMLKPIIGCNMLCPPTNTTEEVLLATGDPEAAEIRKTDVAAWPESSIEATESESPGAEVAAADEADCIDAGYANEAEVDGAIGPLLE
jgi:hypothetical protein